MSQTDFYKKKKKAKVGCRKYWGKEINIACLNSGEEGEQPR